MQKVTVVSLIFSIAAIMLLNAHKANVLEVRSTVEQFQKSIYLQSTLQLLSHYLVNSLHDQESKLPRIIDIKAHSTKL